LVALPALAGVTYLLGGLVLAVQAQQVALPWQFVISNVDARTFLSYGLRTIVLSAVSSFAFVAGVWLSARLMRGKGSTPPRDETFFAQVDRVLVPMLGVAFAFVAGVSFTLAILSLSGLSAVSPASWAVGAGVGAFASGVVSRYRVAQRTLNGTAALLTAAVVVALGPLTLTLGGATVLAAFWWVLSLDRDALRVSPFRHPQSQALVAAVGLTYGLMWATASDLKLPSRELPGAATPVGILASANGKDLVVRCDSSRSDSRPPAPEVLVIPTAGPATEAVYRVPRRDVSSVVSVLLSKRASSAPFEYDSHDCGGLLRH
jgi:hypothetical protein